MIKPKEKTQISFFHRLALAPVEKIKELIDFLPERERPLPIAERQTDIQKKSLSLEALFDKIHKSWYLSYLQTLSLKDVAFFTSSFSDETRNSLLSHIESTPHFYKLRKKEKHFFLNRLFQSVFKESPPLPIGYLEDNPLIGIATANFENLQLFIFYLGLFDVAYELKKIIRSSVFRALEESLSKEELDFIKIALEMPNKTYLADLGLATWNGDKEALRSAIFDRGLNRLALAFSICEPDLVWYVMHTLEKNNAQKFESFMHKKIDEKSYSELLGQILDTWERVCTVFH